MRENADEGERERKREGGLEGKGKDDVARDSCAIRAINIYNVSIRQR